MTKAGSNITYAYLSPKLHAIWGQAAVGARLEALLEAQNDQPVNRLLESLGIDPERQAEVRRELTARLVAELDRIRRLLEPAATEFYTLFVARFFFENLKAILHYRRETRHTVDLRLLLIDSPGLPRLDLDALLEAKTLRQFHERLPESGFRRRLLPVLLKLEETGNTFAAEAQMDRIYYGELLAAAAKASSQLSVPALLLCRREVDLVNIIMLLRNLELYHIEQEPLLELLIPGGERLTASRLQQLAGITELARLLTALPSPYAGMLNALAGRELYRRENVLWEYLEHTAHRAFYEFANPAASVAAFPFLKWFETLNIGRLFEGLRVGLAAAEIRSMMIGAGHVQTG